MNHCHSSTQLTGIKKKKKSQFCWVWGFCVCVFVLILGFFLGEKQKTQKTKQMKSNKNIRFLFCMVTRVLDLAHLDTASEPI